MKTSMRTGLCGELTVADVVDEVARESAAGKDT